MGNENPVRMLRINEAMVWTGTIALGLLLVGFLLASFYRTIQSMSYEAMPPVPPVVTYVTVTAVAVASFLLILGVWGRLLIRWSRSAAVRGRSSVDPASTWSARAALALETIEEEEPALASASISSER